MSNDVSNVMESIWTVTGFVVLLVGLALVLHWMGRKWAALWRGLWRARKNYGPIAAIRYRLGVRLLYPYLERRWNLNIPIVKEVGEYGATGEDPVSTLHRSQLYGRQYELADLLNLDPDIKRATPHEETP